MRFERVGDDIEFREGYKHGGGIRDLLTPTTLALSAALGPAHPTLPRSRHKPAGAQLIFTTHDVSLLNHLNRDEVWLTEKNDEGMSQLEALVEYSGERVRKSINLERACLQGRFGAVPQTAQPTGCTWRSRRRPSGRTALA